MDFTITISDETHLSGITAAREAHNAANPDNQLADDKAYVQHVMSGAAASYAEQFQTDVTKIDAKIAVLQALKAKYQ